MILVFFYKIDAGLLKLNIGKVIGCWKITWIPILGVNEKDHKSEEA
jgi:hypothetical protein